MAAARRGGKKKLTSDEAACVALSTIDDSPAMIEAMGFLESRGPLAYLGRELSLLSPDIARKTTLTPICLATGETTGVPIRDAILSREGL